MGFAVANRTTFKFRVWEANAPDSPIDEATEVRLTLATMPDFTLHRWDGAIGIRDATAQELADEEAAKVAVESIVSIDGIKAIKALALVMMTYCNQLKAGTYTTKTASDVRDIFITAFKSLS